jgi:large subunit ribosomal protein L18
MNKSAVKQQKRTRRHTRIRAKISGTQTCPRLCVFRSNTAVYAQLIDDEKGTTICAIDSRKVTGATPREQAFASGTEIATLAKKLGIEKVVFDRGGFLFTGSIKDLAEGARKGGLQF